MTNDKSPMKNSQFKLAPLVAGLPKWCNIKPHENSIPTLLPLRGAIPGNRAFLAKFSKPSFPNDK
jgi:hypothetical protein